MSEIETISDEMSHAGEKGRNNESVLSQFLKRNLPTRFTVSTGKVIGVGGVESGQIDLIIHDRLDTPAFIEAHEWSLVPVETVYAVISVKTSIDKPQMDDALESIKTVRSLPRQAATFQVVNGVQHINEKDVLRPRAFVFAFKSNWRSFDSCNKSFKESITVTNDDLRPNAMCILNQGFLIRRAYTEQTILFKEFPLMHFFMFLVQTMMYRPRYNVDLSKYFVEDYG